MSSLFAVRTLWRPARAFSVLRRPHLQRSLHHLQQKKVMEVEKPWALISEVGENGYLEEMADMLRKHFRIVSHKDFLQNPSEYDRKIQVLFLWNSFPEATRPLLGSLPALKMLSNGGVGIDHLDVPYIASLGVKVSNTPSAVSDATADMAMALLLSSARRVVEGHQFSLDPKSTDVPQCMMGDEVTGATLGIIGMGQIGHKIAQRCRGFDMKILYHNRSRRSVEDEQAVGATYCQTMDELLKESDFVVLGVNLSPETTALISHRELALMKPTARLVNISRGLVVDQDALLHALQSGTIRGAATDVTYPEPLPRDHPLLGLSNLVITPHIGTNTMATVRRMVQSMIENALAALKGQPIPNEVKPK